MKKTIKQRCKRALAVTLATACVLTLQMPVSTEAADEKVNLAQGKAVTASYSYSGMGAELAVDGKLETRWAAEGAPGGGGTNQWLRVDLGEEREFDSFNIYSEVPNKPELNQKIRKFKIEGSNNDTDWTMVYDAPDKAEGYDVDNTVTLEAAVTYRYVKITVEKLVDGAWPSISLREFEIMGIGDGTEEPEPPTEQDPQVNVARGKNAVANASEDPALGAEKAVDGDATGSKSRWASAVQAGPHWIYVDLGSQMDVKTVKVFWETRKATSYKIELSDDGKAWETVYANTDRPKQLNEKIVLDEVHKARYVRLYIDSFTADDPDGGVRWNTISIYEMEVYGGLPKESATDVAEQITIKQPELGDDKLEITYPVNDEYEISYNGTDYEQVVDTDLTIYEPVVDTEVKVSFKITTKETGEYIFKEIPVTIPGTYQYEEGENAAPNVLPELREWKGHTGTFEISDGAKVVYAGDALADVANVFAEDYEDITGKAMKPVMGSKSDAGAGDYFFELTEDTSKGLKEEGSLMEVGENVVVTAEDPTGAYWATRTILQSLKVDGNIPCGIARDYPLYKVRGFIMDVARKTFKMDFLEQLVKEMSWYKLNDFQVHLNDNLIPLEHYNKTDEDGNYLEYNEELMNAYSAFRLESDIKEGGNGGLNKKDLTSKDVFYTKDEFRSFIKESRVRGVNIVPEIDTPAHSLALTRVRPDLRQGLNGRQNDHLDLINQYDESLSFVQSIFSEYMTDRNPVFDEETIVHVGADEYGGSIKGYRNFCNDMMDYVQDTGRTARIWGSLTSMTDKDNPENNIEVRGDRSESGERTQINLWNFGWANMDEMYDLGFDLINCNDGNYYIVPNAGYYSDYISDGTMYDLAINSVGGVTIPAGDKQMVGGAFAVWNDMTDYLDNGVSEFDVYDRIENAIPLFGAKLWGKSTDAMSLADANTLNDQTGHAPGVDFEYTVNADENGVIAEHLMDTADTFTEAVNAEIAEEDGKNALKLNGGESYAKTSLITAGLNNDLRVKVKRTSASTDEQILFESEYGSIKAVQKETGRVGFSRENYDYSFNYTLPVDTWVELEFKNVEIVNDIKNSGMVELWVNGEHVDTIGDGEIVEGRPLLATMMMPMERIGSASHAFIGYVDDVRLGVNAEYSSAMELEYAVTMANALIESGQGTDELKALVNDAKVILDQFAPNAEEVQNKADAINVVIGALEFEEADYRRVDAYIEMIPDDTSAFTEESVAVLNRVLASVRRGLPKSMQDTVDGYEKAIENALNGLVVKTESNVNYIDPALLTATADCYQDDSAHPNKAMDGDVNTMWHSKWNPEAGHPAHWIDFATEEPMKVNGLTYVPRAGAGNGTLLKYRIESSDDGQNYTTVKEGEIKKTTEPTVFTFDTVTTKHIRLVYVSATSVDASAAEIMLHKADVAPDAAGLQAVIDQAKGLENKGYTEESWNALQAKIAEAEALLENESPDANDVEIMKRELAGAMAALRLEEKSEEPEPEPEPVDRTDLEKAIAKAKALKAADYTKDSWSKLEKALADAEALDKDATQEEVDAAEKAINKAIDGLKKVKPEDPKPTDPKPGDDGKGDKPKPNDKGDNGAVQTGDSTNVMLWFVMMAVALIGILAVKKRER